MSQQIKLRAGNLLNNLRDTKPLVHHITNYVTVNDCANITLAIGASPIMADDMMEVESITAISSALVLNIGTLNQRTVETMLAAGKKANELNIPIVLDPVGTGASAFRNETVKSLLEQIQFSVIRGNMSEIRFIAGLHATTKGVDVSEADSAQDIQSSIEIAKTAAKQHHCVIAITGATDIVSDGNHTVCLENGHQMLSNITGTGCMCSSLIGSFCSMTDDYVTATTSGLLAMGIAGEIAFEKAGHLGTGSYRVSIIDEISMMNTETLQREAKVDETKN